MKSKKWIIKYKAYFTRKETETILGFFERTNLVRHTEEHYCTVSYEEPVEMNSTSALYDCMDHFSSIKTEEEKSVIVSGSTTLGSFEWKPLG